MLRNLYKPLISGLIVILLLVACASTASIQDDRVKALEDKVNSISELKTQLSALQGEVTAMKGNQTGVTSLQSKLDALSTQVSSLNSNSHSDMSGTLGVIPVSGNSADNPFALSVAQFVLDTSGFHGMAKSISTNKVIDAAYPGTVNRTYKVLSQTTWPTALAEQGVAFTAMLKDFAAALTANNLDDATRLSDQVHDAQHELSHAIDDWDAKSMAPASTSADQFALRVAQFVLDTAGFHGMAESISTTQKIDAAYAGPVNRAYKVLSQTAWPEALGEQGKTFTAMVKDFAAALTANNVEDATKLSDQVHDAQHELSHAIDDWFSKAADAHTH